jgi:hypothetical protein
MVCHQLRSCSTAKLMEFGDRAGHVSVTVALTVRSPSASEPISSSRRMNRLLVAVVEFHRGFEALASARRVLNTGRLSE